MKKLPKEQQEVIISGMKAMAKRAMAEGGKIQASFILSESASFHFSLEVESGVCKIITQTSKGTSSQDIRW